MSLQWELNKGIMCPVLYSNRENSTVQLTLKKHTPECPAASKTATNMISDPQILQNNESDLRLNAYMNMYVLGLPGCHLGSETLYRALGLTVG